MNLVLKSVLIGTVLTLALFGLGYVADTRGAETLSFALYWQAWVLQTSLPCVTVSGVNGLLCENVAVSKAVFYAGLPLGVALYSLLAYAGLRLLGRRADAVRGNGPRPAGA